MDRNKISGPQKFFSKLYQALSEKNTDRQCILTFLSNFYFYLYLGKKFRPEILIELKSVKTPEELTESLTRISKSFSVISDPQLLPLPEFTETFLSVLTESDFPEYNWSELTAADYCNIFDSLINDKHSNGMYFTSRENIQKVIKPLFLDELNAECEKLLSLKTPEKLKSFLNKISHLTFLDPSCGVGNFLIETFYSLKYLEERILEVLDEDQKEHCERVTTDQFYGIEIDKSVTVIARNALLIAEIEYSSFPNSLSRPNKNIIQANALQIDWNTLIESNELSYIFGNPPFLGARIMDKEQKNDLKEVFGMNWPYLGNLDYVSGWFKKAFDYMKNTEIEAAFVSTNSICQGISATYLLKPLIESGLVINFAFESFKWDTTASVFVVIIGFSARERKKDPCIYTSKGKIRAGHINGYLLNGPELYTESRTRPLCDTPEMGIGNKPVDGGNYLFTRIEYESFIQNEPESARFFRPFYGTRELLSRKPRYCLWLGETPEETYRHLPCVMERVNRVRDFRLKSKSQQTRKYASKPTHFHVENIPETSYLAVPRVSPVDREYISIGFMTPEKMASDSLLIIPGSDLYHFGILTSKLHMTWVHYVCGRLGENYRYSKEIVYNNFPWPEAGKKDREKIIKTAEHILKVREKYPDLNLNSLYKPRTMPKDLKQAHKANDKAVFEAYGFDLDYTEDEAQLITLLFKRYESLINNG